MSTAGNIEAIRDWANNYFPKREEINDLFLRIGSGLTAYNLTIIGDTNTQTITIIEDTQTDPQTYEVQTIGGEYTGLFFFHTGSTIHLYDNGVLYNEHVLSDTTDTVYLRPLVIATSKMTSNNTPNDIGTCSASNEMTYGGYTYAAWRAFNDNIPSGEPIWWVSGSYSSGGTWIKYSFNDPVCIKRVVVNCISNGFNATLNNQSRDIRAFKFQASNDNSTWVDLFETRRTIAPGSDPYSSDKLFYPINPVNSPDSLLKNTTKYKHYRVLVTDTWDIQAVGITTLKMYKLQDSPSS